MVGVCSLSVSTGVLAGEGVGAAEELAKATGACEAVRARAVDQGRCEQWAWGRSDAMGLAVGWTDVLAPAGWRAADRFDLQGCVSVRLCRCAPRVQPDVRISIHIVRVVSDRLDTSSVTRTVQ